ncbi:hypothetical protein Clacol_000528 [Clathrus columnatus]|uniref:snRNA-activating protein complex subunit 3 n=1 Tax=Clathrus columnatus TaxID=1419009 RepID=A0AAV4ZYN1_9AGAM|nr:hypothetical protein Clacol_000528 [Clathrus columnatus]
MTCRPPVFTWNEELHFGPSSEIIPIVEFQDEAENLAKRSLCPWLENRDTPESDSYEGIAVWKEWEELPQENKMVVQAECSLDDLKAELNEICCSQTSFAYLQRRHSSMVASLNDDPNKVRSIPSNAEPWKHAIENVPLKMWKLQSTAKPYVRKGRVSDQNALAALQFNTQSLLPEVQREILIFITLYTRIRWYPHGFSRTSQHVLTSSSTLKDVWDCVSCMFKGHGKMPKEIVGSESHEGMGQAEMKHKVVGYQSVSEEDDHDSVVVTIGNNVYCDGYGTPDYADRLLSHIELLKPTVNTGMTPELMLAPYERPKRTQSYTKGPPLENVTLRSLTLRINEPYWMMHRANCDHWFVVDEIRLQNPRDPISRYPITLQRTPTLRPLCRICGKIPATLSVLNDMRLGESPFLVCTPCWELFGGAPKPKESESIDDRVVVVPLLMDI